MSNNNYSFFHIYFNAQESKYVAHFSPSYSDLELLHFPNGLFFSELINPNLNILSDLVLDLDKKVFDFYLKNDIKSIAKNMVSFLNTDEKDNFILIDFNFNKFKVPFYLNNIEEIDKIISLIVNFLIKSYEDFLYFLEEQKENPEKYFYSEAENEFYTK